MRSKQGMLVLSGFVFTVVGLLGSILISSFPLRTVESGMCPPDILRNQDVPLDVCLNHSFVQDVLQTQTTIANVCILLLWLGLGAIYLLCFVKQTQFSKRLAEKTRKGWLIFGLIVSGSLIIEAVAFAWAETNSIVATTSGLLVGCLAGGLYFSGWSPSVEQQEVQKQDEELVSLQQEVKDNPQSVQAWTELGYKQQKLDNNEDALVSANKAIELISGNKSLEEEDRKMAFARAWVLRGAALSTMQGKEIDAIAACDEALGFDDNNLDALYYKGRAYVFQERDTLAHQMFDRILRRNPMYKDALLSKGSLYIIAEDFEGLRAIANSLIRHFPNDVEGYRMQGLAYQFEGEKAGLQLEQRKELLGLALASFNTALEIDPKNASIYFLLAGPYAVMGDTGKALELLNQGLQIEPNNPLLQEAKADIVGKRTNEVAKNIAGTAGRMAVGGGIGLAKGSVGAAKIFFDVLRKS